MSAGNTELTYHDVWKLKINARRLATPQTGSVMLISNKPMQTLGWTPSQNYIKTCGLAWGSKRFESKHLVHVNGSSAKLRCLETIVWEPDAQILKYVPIMLSNCTNFNTVVTKIRHPNAWFFNSHWCCTECLNLTFFVSMTKFWVFV